MECNTVYWRCENCNAKLKITVIPAAGVCWESLCPVCRENFKVERGIINGVEILTSDEGLNHE